MGRLPTALQPLPTWMSLDVMFCTKLFKINVIQNALNTFWLKKSNTSLRLHKSLCIVYQILLTYSSFLSKMNFWAKQNYYSLGSV